MLVVSVGAGVHGFTLDPTIGEFVLTHPDMKMPQRGQIYSLNDARWVWQVCGVVAGVELTGLRVWGLLRKCLSEWGSRGRGNYAATMIADNITYQTRLAGPDPCLAQACLHAFIQSIAEALKAGSDAKVQC